MNYTYMQYKRNKVRLANHITDTNVRNTPNGQHYESTPTTPSITRYTNYPTNNAISHAFALFDPNLHKHRHFILDDNDLSDDPVMHYHEAKPTTQINFHDIENYHDAIARLARGIVLPKHIDKRIESEDPIGIAHEQVLENPHELENYRQELKSLASEENIENLIKDFMRDTTYNENPEKYAQDFAWYRNYRKTWLPEDRLRRQLFKYIIGQSSLKNHPLSHDLASLLTGIKIDPENYSNI